MPTFSPGAGATPGLDLLAAAAGLPTWKAPPMPATMLGITSKGPYNPAASLPTRIVKRILELDFMEMAEVSYDSDLPQSSSRPQAPARLPVTDISVWVERFSLMAAVLVLRFPDKAPELFAYQASIIRAERNYEGKHWVIYDRQYRWEALARNDLNWSVLNSRLYNEAFTGRAKSIARCEVCLSDSHTASTCPQNPTLHLAPWAPDTVQWPGSISHRPPNLQSAICRRWNEGRCKFPACKYRHECLVCWGTHRAPECPRKRHDARSRSPGTRHSTATAQVSRGARR